MSTLPTNRDLSPIVTTFGPRISCMLGQLRLRNARAGNNTARFDNGVEAMLADRGLVLRGITRGAAGEGPFCADVGCQISDDLVIHIGQITEGSQPRNGRFEFEWSAFMRGIGARYFPFEFVAVLDGSEDSP
jgi:hypothetical protein